MSPDVISQPRLLLRRLHGVMASGAEPQDKLDRIVRVVAQNMVAEVCSVYLGRAGRVMELFATEGLNSEAVHLTRMSSGEGLVGFVAERGLPLSLSEATTHPRFSYRPETGEDLYHSFLGVPIIKGQRVIGVLVVQNVASRRYTGEEIEVLQTIAMVIAELVTTGEFVNPDELFEDATETGTPITLDGQPFAGGFGVGQVHFRTPPAAIVNTVSQDEQEEFDRLDGSLNKLKLQFDDLLAKSDTLITDEYRDVIETFRMFAVDQGWRDKMHSAIRSGLTAEAAARRVQQANRARMRNLRDPYLRERMNDFDDMTDRLIRIIQGAEEPGVGDDTDIVLVARSMGAADLMEYDTAHVKGVVIEEGSHTSHLTIIARAMGIALIGQVQGLLTHAQEGEEVVLDAEQGRVYLRPTEDIIDTYVENVRLQEERLQLYSSEKDLPAMTRDGTDVNVMMNAGLLVDLPRLDQVGGAGIGLFRTEFQFLVAKTLPRVIEQEEIYRAALDAAGPDRPVVFRTLDIGGDKHVPFLPRAEEENPAMGWRAIRVGLDRPALLRFQLRALLYAAQGRDLHVMFPMIAEVSELKRCKQIVNKELKRLEKHGRTPPKNIYVGCMLEIPALVYQLEALSKEVDFLSLGTNDLMQFFFACDRSTPALSGRYDMLAPQALRFLKTIEDTCRQLDVPISVCGEMGGQPLEFVALMGLGFRKFSVSPGAVGRIKRVIRQLDMPAIEDFISVAIESNQRTIRDSLANFMRDRGVKI